MIYNYEGKLASNPKIPSVKFEFLNGSRISISQDILAIVDGYWGLKKAEFNI
jgi:hypothetical protein